MWESIKRFFDIVWQKVKGIISRVFTHDFNVFIAAFWDVAVRIVSRLESENISNEDKRKEAYAYIKNTVEQKWKQTVSESWIYFIIELALQSIKRG